MGKYEPPYTISNKMLELVSSISEKVGKISSHRELEARPHLRKNKSNPIHSFFLKNRSKFLVSG